MSGLNWPDDFLDCISYGPSEGEEGYIGDYFQPLEYPCNCSTCTREWREAMGLIDEDDSGDEPGASG
jgi:hypothetical protein